ncbi:MAG: 5-(carboxyamino)imidazole ribonucleotide synthase [Nitrospira sp.]
MGQSILEPGCILGVLGGGQLGAMFASAARRMGYRVAVWDPDPDAPAHGIADRSFVASFSDSYTFETFSSLVQAVTFEWENVPADLCERLEHRCRVRPSSSILRTIQDRIRQKQFLLDHSLPVPPFTAIDSPLQLAAAVRSVGFPAVCKTARSGYDGKGQWIIREEADVEGIAQMLWQGGAGHERWIVERFVPFEQEVSVVVVRGENGEIRTFPVAHNLHEGGILRMTQVPAPISTERERAVSVLAEQAVVAMKGIGVFCVECFQTASGLLINEMAPRPHNSGHYTLDACTVSQFEQQVRMLCGLPLGEVRLLSAAAMVNLLGAEIQIATTGRGYRRLTAIPGAVLHVYGKRQVRPGRKMGHVTFLAERREEAVERAQWLMRVLSSTEDRAPHYSHLL